MLVDLQTFPKTKMKKAYEEGDEDEADRGYGFSEMNSEMRYEAQTDDSSAAGTASMAAYDRANDLLLKLPFSVTLDLMNTLDVDRGWESVAAAAGFTFDHIQQLGFKLTQNASPTRALLWQLGSQNYTVHHLYEILKLAKRIREMKTLEAYVKEGGMKGAAVKPKSPPSSLSSLLTQIKESDQRSQGRPGMSFSVPASELNFNKPSSPIDKAKVIPSKNYEDKIIPGNDSPQFHPLKEANGNISRKMSSDHHFSLPTTLLRTEGYKSLPPFCQPFSQQQTEGARTEGVENIPHSIPHSLATSLANKSSPAHSVASSSFNSEHKLDASSSSSSDHDNTESKVSFSYRELLNATDGFHKNKILGEGAFGNVYKGTLHQQECAIKRLFPSTTDNKKSEQVKSELAALLKYRHENIVPLYGYAENTSELCLVYQYMVNGSLEDRLLHKNDTPSLTWERRLNILIGSCKGLNFLHTMGDPPLIHGDIKSANILLDQYFEAKLGDFGQAKYATRSSSTDTTGFTHITVAETTTRLFGTKAYLAPELISNGTQSVKSDIYALGVVFMEVCSGLKAYDQSRNVGTFLVDYFRNEVADKEESVWKEHFQDRTLPDVSDDTFVAVLKLALKCVNTAKKARPDTKKLLGELKLMYKQNKDRNGDDGTYDSISTSLQIDSRLTNSSYFLTSVMESQLEGPSAPHVSGPDQHMNIRRQLLNYQPPSQKLPEQLMSPVKEPLVQKPIDVAAYSTNHTQTTVGLRDHPSADNPSKSFPPSVPLSVPLLLQEAYDRQQGREVIDRLSGVLQKKEAQELEEYPSDPKKLQKIHYFDISSSYNAFQKGNPEPDGFPEADPKKLAQLMPFEEANFGTGDHSAADPTCLNCDPHKLACLLEFKDNVYKLSAENRCDTDTQQPAVVQSRQELSSQKDNFMNRLDLQDGFQASTTTYAPTYVPQNSPLYLPLCTSPVIIEQDVLGYATDGVASLELKQHLKFGDTAKQSGGSSVGNGWSGDQADVAGAAGNVDKQMKLKMSAWFDKYNELLQNADDDDDDGCNNDEEEETDH